jgi:peptidoglycan hydrolase CwlO-like protein
MEPFKIVGALTAEKDELARRVEKMVAELAQANAQTNAERGRADKLQENVHKQSAQIATLEKNTDKQDAVLKV